jgi:16S rRNA (guanine527-N7)-methyltransferase
LSHPDHPEHDNPARTIEPARAATAARTARRPRAAGPVDADIELSGDQDDSGGESVTDGDDSATDLARPVDDLAELLRPSAPTLTDEQVELLARYRDALHERNKITNLTAVRNFEGIERRLILESLRLLPAFEGRVREGNRVIDIGTGAGLPGMVLAIARPDLQFTLLDATGKKVQFVLDTADALGLANVRPIQGRAEELAREIGYRGQYRIAVARAVSSLPTLVELGLPLVMLGGFLLLPKGLEINAELATAEKAARLVGGNVVGASILPDVGSSVETRLVEIEKIVATPKAYPRRTGIPAHSPLGIPEKKKADRRPR